jgi:hypothetical protein
MGLFGRAKPKRTVVKDYGRDTFLIAFNLLLAPFMASRGWRVGLLSEADVLDRMEKDALRMGDQGYRVVSADRYAVPWLAQLGWGDKATVYRVTYELEEAPAEEVTTRHG